MERIRYRKATAQDARAIRALIWRVGINPLGLDWQRFVVAVDEKDEIAGCGQVKPHRDGSLELASIAVRPEMQGQGIGKVMISRLMAEHRQVLYLTCRASVGPYYEKFGFVKVENLELPAYFRLVKQAFGLLRRVFPGREELLVMVHTFVC